MRKVIWKEKFSDHYNHSSSQIKAILMVIVITINEQ